MYVQGVPERVHSLALGYSDPLCFCNIILNSEPAAALLLSALPRWTVAISGALGTCRTVGQRRRTISFNTSKNSMWFDRKGASGGKEWSEEQGGSYQEHSVSCLTVVCGVGWEEGVVRAVSVRVWAWASSIRVKSCNLLPPDAWCKIYQLLILILALVMVCVLKWSIKM